jgi:REP element-mobilizing transposase RayT
MTRHRTVIGAHHILMLYAHWAVNDPRGSGSDQIRDPKFESLGDIHHGRKPEDEQPSRDELRAFHEAHRELLKFPLFWIDHCKRAEIACAIAEAIRTHGYTCYACAICANHIHLVIRTHKHKAREQWMNIADAIRGRLRHKFHHELAADHPIISSRPYSVLLFTPDEMRGRISYVENNPLKEGQPRQHWEFVTPYDNWPFHKKR